MIHRKVQHGLIRSFIFSAAALPGLAAAQGGAPVIDSVTFHEDTAGRYMVVYPEFHFHDPSGTVRFIHRELVATNSPKPTNVRDGVIDFPPVSKCRAPRMSVVGLAAPRVTT